MRSGAAIPLQGVGKWKSNTTAFGGKEGEIDETMVQNKGDEVGRLQGKGKRVLVLRHRRTGFGF
jgi:hypothetical protein